ncbi:protein tas-like isoform X5 [Mangifera indica]|uniref:protein tas-like isoform X5 n=1 Tax=Mangifera indica TaxID=29780 RepID=UPI001CFC1BB1|nr:protein tas-like isoform X5 [Mangifera indica]
MPGILQKPLTIVWREHKWITLIFIKFIGLIDTFQCLEKLSTIQPNSILQLVSKNSLMPLAKLLMLIRYIGLSNETPYGVMTFLRVAEKVPQYPKILTVQNSYNLLCRTFDSGLAECCHHERIWLLAYSPLAMGILSGKYFSPDGGPADARLNLFKGKYSEGESRYNLSNGMVKAATMEYLDIARRYDIHPVSLAFGFKKCMLIGLCIFTVKDFSCLLLMALESAVFLGRFKIFFHTVIFHGPAFVLRHPLVASAVFGATKSRQLQEVINACQVELTAEIVADINRIHAMCPSPCP